MKKQLVLLIVFCIICINQNHCFAQTSQYKFVKSFGGNEEETGGICSSDKNGNIIFAGRFESDSISFDSITLYNSSTYGRNFYIAKLDPNGNIIWAKSAGSSSYFLDIIMGCAIDDMGNIFLTGYFHNDSITFDSITLVNTPGGGSDVFIVKYDSNGAVQWARSEGGALADLGHSCATDGNGNILIVGGFQSDSISFGTTTLYNKGVFLVKYD